LLSRQRSVTTDQGRGKPHAVCTRYAQEGESMQTNLHSQEQPIVTTPKACRSAPGPRYLNPFRMLAEFRRDRLKFYMNLATFGDVVRIQVGHSCFHFVAHPDHIKYILQDNHHNYGRSSL